MIEVVRNTELWHFSPVNAAHIFPPAKNLAHETFNLVDGNLLRTPLPFFYRCIDDFLWGDHFDVHRKTQVCMVE